MVVYCHTMLPVITAKEIEYEITRAHENRQASMLATVSLLYGITVVFVALRIISRKIQGLGIGRDDYLIVVATVSAM